MNRTAGVAAMVAAALVGGSSLLLFAAFLVAGPFVGLRFTMPASAALVADAGLSLAFFLQHSVMVRQGFKARLARWIPRACHAAVYAIASGVFLAAVVLLWQPSGTRVWALHGPIRLLPRVVWIAAIAGFVWGIRSLRVFDPFGRRSIRAALSGRPPRRSRFIVRGPYLWVRHPLYLFTLVLIWSVPEATLDRVLFDVLWTAWIAAGARWEERDLVAEFGADYQRYQRAVPMLLPWRGRAGPPLIDSVPGAAGRG